MLKNIFLFFLIFSSHSAFAQQDFYLKLSDEKCVNNIYDIISFNNDGFLVALNRKNCDNVNSLVSGEIFHVSNKGTILKTIKKFGTEPSIIENILSLNQITDGFFIITKQFDTQTGQYSTIFYQCDKNFNTVKSLEFSAADSPEYVGTYYDKLNKKIIYTYFDASFNSYIGSIQTDCKNNKISNNLGQDSSFILYNICKVTNENDKYLISSFRGVFKIDSNLNIITTLPSVDDNNNAKIMPYGKDKYLMLAEESYGFPANLSKPAYDDITCKKLDENWNVLQHRRLGKSFNEMKADTFDSVGIKALDFKDPNKIYVGWSSFRDYEFLVPFEEQDMWVGIAQLDSNLVPRWTRYFWGNGYNHLIGLVATPDNGVLLYGNQSAIDSLYPNGFLLKLNENGILSSKDEVKEDNIFVTIGPNPFKNNITFAIGQSNEVFEDLELYIYDTFGRFVRKETLDYGLNHFSFSNLSNATYFYSITTKNKLIKHGKLIKIE